MSHIFWVDEEENSAYPDILALRFIGHTVSLEMSAGAAVDWILAKRSEIAGYAAFVVDIQLPIYGDERFTKSKDSAGNFAGLLVCELIRESLGDGDWEIIRPKIVLYTQLPGTERTAIIEAFARTHKLHFFRKSARSTIIRELIKRGLIPDPDEQSAESGS